MKKFEQEFMHPPLINITQIKIKRKSVFSAPHRTSTIPEGTIKKVGSEVGINLHELWKQIEEQSAEHSEKQENN